MEISLTFMSGSRDGETILLECAAGTPSLTFGRQPSCAVCLTDDPEVSRQHARLTRRGDDWVLEDCGSANGTFLGEFRDERRLIQPTSIPPNSIFRIGLTRLRLNAGGPCAAAEAIAAGAQRIED